MRVLVAWMPLRWPHRTKFRVFTGKALLTCPYWISFYPKALSGVYGILTVITRSR
jgi:hypothetical protein